MKHKNVLESSTFLNMQEVKGDVKELRLLRADAPGGNGLPKETSAQV